jgi:hypothetical protein
MTTKITDVVVHNEGALPQSTFTVVAATDVFTSGAAHGFSIGDKLQLTTATTLPAGLSLLTNYYVISIPSTTTFKLSATPNGTSVDATDTGTGTHTYHLKGRMIYVGDYSEVKIALNFTTTPTMTVKVQGSNQNESVDCSLAQSDTNRWDYVDVTDAEDGASIDGDTGIACAGSADNRIFTINDNAYEWVSVTITAWTAGQLSVRVSAYSI